MFFEVLELSRICSLQLDNKDNRPQVPKLSGQTQFTSWCQRSGDSKHLVTQVPFRTGQAEASSTVILVKEHSGSSLPSAPLSSATWLQRDSLYIVSGGKKKNKLRKNNVNKVRYPSLLGILGMDSLRNLLAATIPRRNQTVNSVTIWRDGSWWSL